MSKLRICDVARAALILAAVLCWQSPSFAQTKKEQPETVLVTYRVKAGSEKQLEGVIADHWATLQRLNLVTRDVHVLLRQQDGDRTSYFELGTWRDSSIPEHAPAAVQEFWKRMNLLVETRDGRPGIEISEVSFLENLCKLSEKH